MSIENAGSNNDYMQLGACWDHNAAYTWMAWIKLTTDTNAFAVPFCTAASASVYEGDAVRTTSGGTLLKAFTVISNTFNQGSSGGDLSDAGWHHAALVRSTTFALDLYFDGSIVSSESTSVASRGSAADAFLTIVSQTDAAPRTNIFEGRIAYMKVWQAALDAGEIAAEMASVQPVRTANLWDWWLLSGGNYAGQYAGHDWIKNGSIADAADPPVDWYVAPSGIASAETFGTPQANLALLLSGIASAETFGVAEVNNSGSEQTVIPSAIASAEAYGAPTVAPGSVAVVADGIASGTDGQITVRSLSKRGSRTAGRFPYTPQFRHGDRFPESSPQQGTEGQQPI